MIRRIIMVIVAIIALTTANAQTTEQLVVKNGRVQVVKVDTTKTKSTKAPEKVGDYTVNGKVVTVYRGSRGGYFYYTGKTDKNGKPVKKYIKIEKS